MKKMVEYLEEDRERVFGGLQSALTPEAAQAVLEKEADRLLLQYNEACASVRVRDAASGMMQALRSSLPLLDSAGAVRVWRGGRGISPADGAGSWSGGPSPAGSKKTRGTGGAGLLFWIGAALAAASFFLPALLAGGTAALPGLLRGILLPVAGGGCLFFAGRAAGKSARGQAGTGTASGEGAVQERIEIAVDPEKLWNALRGAVLVVDRNLEIAQEAEACDRHRELAAGTGPNGLSAEEIDLFSGLLEMADADSPQMAADIRYYLHKKDVEVLPWSSQNAAWFETLPRIAGAGLEAGRAGLGLENGNRGLTAAGPHPGKGGPGFCDGNGGVNRGPAGAGSDAEEAITIRPALAQGGKLLKKGIAVR